jgi:uncharacterized protein (DUF4415 family)
MKNIVRYTPETLPPVTEKQRARLRALATRPDSEIDTSDIPVLTDEQWKNAVRGGLYRPVKRQVTARVDADVIDWLKSQGKGYQTRINAILRREMLAAHKVRK